MSDNIVSNLDTKSYLLLLRELKKYYNKKFNNKYDFSIREIVKEFNSSLYTVVIIFHYNSKHDSYEIKILTELQVISILRISKLNKINERHRIN